MTAALQRLPDWPLRFDALVCSRMREPFAWGSNDCALFAADALQAITGVDLAAGLRGLGVRAALRHVHSAGGLQQLVPACLRELADIFDAREGDLALVPTAAAPLRFAFGVVSADEGRVVGPSRTGLAWVPLGCAVRLWGVGHG